MARNIYATGPHGQVTPDTAQTILPPAGVKSIGFLVQTNGQMRYVLDPAAIPTATFGFRIVSTDGAQFIPTQGAIKVINETAGNKVDIVSIGGEW